MDLEKVNNLVNLSVQRMSNMEKNGIIDAAAFSSILKDIKLLQKELLSEKNVSKKKSDKVSTANIPAVEPKIYGKDKNVIKGSTYWYRLPITNGAFMIDMERHVFLQQTLMQLAIGATTDDVLSVLNGIAEDMNSIKMNEDFYVANIVSWQQKIKDTISLSKRLLKKSVKDDIVLKCFALLCYRLNDYKEDSEVYSLDLSYDPHNLVDLEATMEDLVAAKYPYDFFLGTLFVLLPTLKESLTQDLVNQYLRG